MELIRIKYDFVSLSNNIADEVKYSRIKANKRLSKTNIYYNL